MVWIDGNTYTTSNDSATFTIQNVNGCDSIVTLNLTITNSNSGTDIQTACDSLVWIDGNTYTTSNDSATFTIQNVNGCDSIVTLNLTITNSNSVTDNQIACGPFNWIDGNTYTESNNTATLTFQNVSGCDSVVTLNLTIGTNSGTDTQTACDSYDWIDGNTYTESNNTAIHTLTNAAGCDSTVTLDLTINNSTTDTINLSGIDSLNWNGFTIIENLDTTVTFANANADGCDSTLIVSIVIEQSTDLENNFNNTIANIFPNPTKAKVTLKSQEMGTYKLIDIYGKKIVQGNKTSLKQEIDLSNLADGLYFILFKQKTFQIIKQ